MRETRRAGAAGARGNGAKPANGNAGPQVLDRAFAILELFTTGTPEWSVTEAAEACRLPVPTVHRLLAALDHHGYVSRNTYTKRYRLGVAALELGQRATASIDLPTASVATLESIAADSGETVLLTAIGPDRKSSVCLERVESRNRLRLSVEPGLRGALHAGASQKALLAFMPKTEIEAVLGGSLPALCVSTITNPDRLRRELESIRRRGWSTSYQETDVGLWGIAVTLLDEAGGAMAAVGLAGPRVRLPATRVPELLGLLEDGSRTIGESVGLRSSLESRPGAPPDGQRTGNGR